MKPYYSEAGIQIFHGDCREVLAQLGAFDLMVTDPPYGIDACGMTLGKGKKDFHRGDWDRDRPEISAILSASTLACIWGGNYFSDVLPPSNDWLVWHKVNDGRSFSECELAWTNYGKNTRHLSYHWSGEVKVHPTQKPMPVMRWCIAIAPGDVRTVVDPFMGSGTTLEAAKNMGLQAIGIEIEEKYCEIAARHLSQGVLQFTELIGTAMRDADEAAERYLNGL